MNPEENNPLTNPGVPNFGVPNNPMSFPGNDQSTADNLSMAGDSLTAAGMAAGPTMPGPISFDQVNSSQASASSLAPDEDPLVPAAPVPGSIGSVTSVPAEPLANPFAPNDNTPSGAMPAPEVQPQVSPYNPFAATTESTSPSTPAGTTPTATGSSPVKPMMTPVKDAINPAFQPAPTPSKPKSSRSISPLTAILAIVSALLLISTIVFAVLFINAKNNPKVVYVPTVSDGESNSQIKFLTCSRNEEMNWLINDAYVVPATRTFSLNYSNDQLTALNDEYQITFMSDIDAIAGRDIFNTATAANLPVPSNVEYYLNGNILNVSIIPTEDPLTDSTAQTYLYGSTEGTPTVALDDVQSFLEANGFTCSVE